MFEYKSVECSLVGEHAYEEPDNTLNEFGSAGWRLAAAIVSGAGRYTFIFEKALPVQFPDHARIPADVLTFGEAKAIPETRKGAWEPAGGGFVQREAREAWDRLKWLCAGQSLPEIGGILEREDLEEILLLHAEWILHDNGFSIVHNSMNAMWVWKDQKYLGSMTKIPGEIPSVNTIDLLSFVLTGGPVPAKAFDVFARPSGPNY